MIPLKKKLEHANNFIAKEIKSVVAWEEGGKGQVGGRKEILGHDGYGRLVVWILLIIFIDIYIYMPNLIKLCIFKYVQSITCQLYLNKPVKTDTPFKVLGLE